MAWNEARGEFVSVDSIEGPPIVIRTRLAAPYRKATNGDRRDGNKIRQYARRTYLGRSFSRC